jgi:exopolysaccharide biosynthesis polyprenyl glycosylphosphotransferase
MSIPPASTQATQAPAIDVGRTARKVALGLYADALLESRAWVRLRLIVDVIVLCVATIAALFANSRIGHTLADQILAAGFAIVVLLVLHARRTPDERLDGSLLDTTASVLGIVSLATMLTIAVASILGGAHPLGLALRLWLFASVYLGASRAALLSVRRQAMRTERFATPALIVGAGMIGARLAMRLAGQPRYGLRPIGFLDSNPLPRTGGYAGPSVPVLGGLADLSEAIKTTGARHVILAFSSEPDHVLVQKIRQCQQLGVHVSLVPRLYESINERTTLDHVGGLPLLTLHSVDPRGWQFALKHAIDRSVALLALLGLSPLLMVIAVAVRFSSDGPVLFRQRRIGRDGREFTIFKFRTMRGSPSADGEADAGWAAEIRLEPAAAESTHAATPSVDRTTPIGQILRVCSLDELPQLLNVLRGEMSLVGPRPERVAYVRDFERFVDHYTDRHRVKSGLTGWAQVNGLRGQTSIADRVEWDNYYIQNWSLRLDLRILALTVAEILRFRDRA